MKTYSERTKSILKKAAAQKKARYKRIKSISVLSGVAAALIAFNLVLFVPYTVGGTDITKYSSSEYYSVIQQLYDLTYFPHKTNNFIEWFGNLHDFGGAQAPADAPTSPGPDWGTASVDGSQSSNGNGSDNSYQEVTNNQTDGVTEGDLFKRSDTHIFYLGHSLGEYDYIINEDKGGAVQIVKYKEDTFDLRVYSIEGENSQKVSEYKIEPDEKCSFAFNTGDREMYLSEDLKTVTVITPCSYYGMLKYTVIIEIDVSDLDNITERNRTYVSGRYVSSRVTDDGMLVVTNFSVPRNTDFSDETSFVPEYGKLGQMQLLPASNIFCPENASTARYTVVYAIGDNGVNDSVALLSFSNDVYVSENNLFTTQEFWKTTETRNEYQLTYANNMSEICIVPYGDGILGEARSVTVSGGVLNRYSLDEYNGTLRAVTTVQIGSNSYTYGKGVPDPYKDMFGDRCLLYCIDLETLEVTAKVQDFAPVGESVKSARFYGNVAYVCTAEVNYGWGPSIPVFNDPVFAFDLTDLENITYKDTGTIPGYSLSLMAFTDNTLLGIGYGDDWYTLKVELYEQTENDVTPLTAYELSDVNFSSEFKAHFVDKKNGLVGLGVRDFGWVGNGIKYEYKLLRYDGYELKEIMSVEMESRDEDEMRATYIDGYLYIFGNDDFIVVELPM